MICPKCNGKGTTGKLPESSMQKVPPWPFEGNVGTQTVYQCDVCKGTGQV